MEPDERAVMEYDVLVPIAREEKAKMQIAISKLEDLKKSQQDAKERLKTSLDCQELAQIVAQGVQQRAHSMIAKVVSQCLEIIFDEPYEFQIVFERKRGKTEARLVFQRDGMEIDPMTSSGGGVLDVAAFALRLAAITLTKPHARRIIIMDEPFRFVSEAFRSRIKDMLESLAEEYGFQFIMVTHIKELICGRNIAL